MGSSSGTSRSSARTCSRSSAAAAASASVGIRSVAVLPGKTALKMHDPAWPQQPQRGGQVPAELLPVGVAEHQVVGGVGEPGQHLEGEAADEPVPAGREARGHIGGSGQPLVLRLDVNSGQDGARAHAPEQPDARRAAAGTDLHYRPGADSRGDEAQRGARQLAHGCCSAYLSRVPPGADERVVLGQEVIDVGESACRDGNGYLPGCMVRRRRSLAAARPREPAG